MLMGNFVRTTFKKFQSLTPDPDTIYFLYDSGAIYLGSVCVGNTLRGKSGIVISDSEPNDPDHPVWLDPDGEVGPLDLDITGASVGQVPTVKSVDENGVPTEWEAVEFPKQVQSDWNQNDAIAADYIKNRPFYSNRTEALNLSLEDFTFHDDGTGMGYYTYECSAPIYEDFNLDTINYYISGTTNSGEAFACNKTVHAYISEDGSFHDDTNYYYLTMSRNSDNNLSIELTESWNYQFQGALTFILYKGVLKQIPVEYIPNEVKSLGMTGAEVGQIVKIKAVDESGAPTEWESVTDSTPFIVEFSDVETDGSCRSSHLFEHIKAAADSGRHVVGHAEYLHVPGDPAQDRYNIYFDLISTMDAAEFRFVDVSRNCAIYINVIPTNLPHVSIRSLSASSSTYGGVKADSAEETDTQPVRIGTDGKLYTATGSSGGGTDTSLGLTGATVGQTVKIKAVGENGAPTEWEAADAASGNDWRLIKTITLEEDVGVIDAFTTDDAGNEFSLSAVKVVSDNTALGKSSTATTGAIRVWLSKRNTNNAFNMGDILPDNAFIEPSFPENTTIGLFAELKKHGCVATVVQNLKGGAFSIWEKRCSEENNIERIAFTTGNANTTLIGAGTILYVWGIDA